LFYFGCAVLSLKCDSSLGECFCLKAVLAVAESLGFSIGLSVETAFLREADTAGTNAHTTYGENIRSFQSIIYFDFVGIIEKGI
jgi:hypothetical protein